MSDAIGNMKFSMEVGILYRSDVISNIKSFCFRENIELNIDEDKGFFSSTYRIKARAEYSKLKHLEFKIGRLLKLINS